MHTNIISLGIDKETFLQYFPLNGLLGERLFAQFDLKKTGYIDFDEFIVGLATVCRGTLNDKIHFIFNMYDVSHDNTVSKQELTTLLNHVPKELFSKYNRKVASTDAYDSDTSGDHTSGGSEHDAVDHGDDYEEVDSYTNHDMVEKAFQECDLNHEGRLTFEEFKMWVQRNPEIMEYIESILPYSSNGPLQKKNHTNKKESLPHMKRISSKASMGSRQDLNHVAGDIFNHSTSSSRDRRLTSISSAPTLERATSGSCLSGKNGDV